MTSDAEPAEGPPPALQRAAAAQVGLLVLSFVLLVLRLLDEGERVGVWVSALLVLAVVAVLVVLLVSHLLRRSRFAWSVLAVFCVGALLGTDLRGGTGELVSSAGTLAALALLVWPSAVRAVWSARD